MPYLKHIVKYINEELIKGLFHEPCFDNKKIICIAQSLPRRNGDNIELVPSYVNEKGEAQYVGPEDDYDLIFYHRINGITVGKAGNFKGYGDDRQVDANIARISMVVFGRRDKLKLTNDELAIHIQANIPEAATKDLLGQLQFFAGNINITDIILNDLQVFNEEFQGFTFFLKPEQFLFKVNYTIESAFLKKCFKKCNC